MMKLRHISAAAALAFAVLPTWAETCEVTVTSNDQMQFDKKAIEVPKSCKSFKVTLTHSGKLPKTAMGHNWVLSKASDMAGIAGEGMAAGAAKQYVKAGDPRVIASTKIIGGGESDSTQFDTAKLEAGQEYAFYCTFPGHSAIMKGTLTMAK